MSEQDKDFSQFGVYNASELLIDDSLKKRTKVDESTYKDIYEHANENLYYKHVWYQLLNNERDDIQAERAEFETAAKSVFLKSKSNDSTPTEKEALDFVTKLNDPAALKHLFDDIAINAKQVVDQYLEAQKAHTQKILEDSGILSETSGQLEYHNRALSLQNMEDNNKLSPDSTITSSQEKYISKLKDGIKKGLTGEKLATYGTALSMGLKVGLIVAGVSNPVVVGVGLGTKMLLSSELGKKTQGKISSFVKDSLSRFNMPAERVDKIVKWGGLLTKVGLGAVVGLTAANFDVTDLLDRTPDVTTSVPPVDTSVSDNLDKATESTSSSQPSFFSRIKQSLSDLGENISDYFEDAPESNIKNEFTVSSDTPTLSHAALQMLKELDLPYDQQNIAAVVDKIAQINEGLDKSSIIHPGQTFQLPVNDAQFIDSLREASPIDAATTNVDVGSNQAGLTEGATSGSVFSDWSWDAFVDRLKSIPEIFEYAPDANAPYASSEAAWSQLVDPDSLPSEQKFTVGQNQTLSHAAVKALGNLDIPVSDENVIKMVNQIAADNDLTSNPNMVQAGKVLVLPGEGYQLPDRLGPTDWLNTDTSKNMAADSVANSSVTNTPDASISDRLKGFVSKVTGGALYGESASSGMTSNDVAEWRNRRGPLAGSDNANVPVSKTAIN